MFSNNHFYRAHLALSTAYSQCHAQCISQRRLILTYLIAANLLLGRFPSKALLARPESAGLLEKFAPIAKAIRRGDLREFKDAVGPEGGNERWLFRKGLLLPILYRCEVLVWRSLARKVFLLTYTSPTDTNTRKAPTLDLNHLVGAAQYCQKRLEGWERPEDTMAAMQKGRTHTNSLFLNKPDLEPPRGKKRKLAAHQGTIYSSQMPTLLEIEGITASLVQQGFLHGFISHSQSRFAILGSKNRGGPLNAGFPLIWNVIKTRAGAGEDGMVEVPGWVREERKMGMGGVVNLSGIARPVGSGG
jgi:hypothetical protein